MKNMDKGLTVPKWGLLHSLAENTPNAPEFICPSPEVLDFNEKRLHWASVVRVLGLPEQRPSFLGSSSSEQNG